MDLSQCPQALDRAAFGRVWRRVMPQDRPDCPFTLDPPPEEQPTQPQQDSAPSPAQPGALAPRQASAAPTPEPVSLCLGPSSAGDLNGLDLLAGQVAQALTLYRSLARRSSAALPLARKKADHLSRLSAARYLISGRRPPKSAPGAGKRSVGALLPLLRERYHAEEGLVLALFTAAQSAADPCLQELYRQLALETQELADDLRSWLERALS